MVALSRSLKLLHCPPPLRVALFGGLFLAGVLPSLAASPRVSPERVRAAAQNAALDVLQQSVLQAGDDGAVEQMLQQAPLVDSEFRAWIRSHPPARRPRVYSDGRVEVDVEIAGGAVAAELSRLASSAPALESALTADLLRSLRSVKRFEGTGEADPRHFASQRVQPIGWEHLEAAGRVAAVEAGRSNFLARLSREIETLSLTDEVTLAELLNAEADLRLALERALLERIELEIVERPSQVVEVRGSITLTMLGGVLAQLWQAERLSESAPIAALGVTIGDLRSVSRRNPQTEIELTGFGLAASDARVQLPQLEQDLDPPSWAAQSLRGTGVVMRALHEPSISEGGLAEARGRAVADLAERTRALSVREGLSLSRLLAERTALKADIVIALHGAREVVVAVDESNQSARVVLELPLERVWRIARRGLIAIEVDQATGVELGPE